MSNPIVWFLGGLDPSGGAGLSMDLKVAEHLGVQSCSIATAITAQNGRVFSHLSPVDKKTFEEQWDSLVHDFPPVVIKVGLLPEDLLASVCRKLQSVSVPIVWDPVLFSTSGKVFWGKNALPVLRENLCRFADSITVNVPEFELLFGNAPCDKRILLKGGHSQMAEECVDLLLEEGKRWHLAHPRLELGKTHGTGCCLASAVACFRALGEDWLSACVAAKSFTFDSLKNGIRSPNSILQPAPKAWPTAQSVLPSVFENAETLSLSFPDCGTEPLGFYPIFSRASALAETLPQGVKTAQLRIKDLTGEKLEDEIRNAVLLGKKFNCRLFINDYWELALKYSAYGVHLGQEDLVEADLSRIQKAGLRLGVSSHSYCELALALAVKPSYVALGPVYPTLAKKMKWAPQGLERLRNWVALSKIPVVAIGGITPERYLDVKATGVSGIAVLTDLAQASNLCARCLEWLRVSSTGSALR